MTVTDTAPADLTSLTYLPWCRPSAWDDRPCVEDDGGSLTYADFGDRVDAAAEQRFGFPLVEGYGLTEGTCVSTLNPVDGPRKVGTVGLPLPGQRVAVMAPDGTLLPPGERGEVVIQGANVMRGYLGRPDATAESLGDGWLHTGDVGVLDEDGYLRLVDRIKDMIIRGGGEPVPEGDRGRAARPPGRARGRRRRSRARPPRRGPRGLRVLQAGRQRTAPIVKGS